LLRFTIKLVNRHRLVIVLSKHGKPLKNTKNKKA